MRLSPLPFDKNLSRKKAPGAFRDASKQNLAEKPDASKLKT
jgi:hypothetical protein